MVKPWLRLLRVKLFPTASSRNSLAVVEAAFIGIVASLSALALKWGVEKLGTLRVHISEQAPALLVLPLAGLIGGALCGLIMEKIAPEITGSGIPQVKAALNQVPMKLDFRVAASKLVAGIISLGCGIPLGREGPTIQIGAALASLFSKLRLSSPSHRRQLIAAGAGAGLAAAFSAPLAGVIFVIEELLKDVSGLTVGAAVIACFFAGVVADSLGLHSLDFTGPAPFPMIDFQMRDIPFLLALGVAAGILGAVFNEGIIAATTLNKRLFQQRYTLRVAIAGLVCGVIVALLPFGFHDYAGMRHMIVEGNANVEIASVAFIVNFILVIIAYGSGVPGGLFSPSLSIGAALGFLAGTLEAYFYHEPALRTATSLSLVGMGAFFTAMGRVPITAMVLVFEMSYDFNLLMPLMVSGMTAHLIGENIKEGSVYDRLLVLQGITLPQHGRESKLLASLTAESIMQGQIDTISGDTKLGDALKTFLDSKHHGFPVLQEGKLVGVVTAVDVTRHITDDASTESTIEKIMTPYPVIVTPETTVDKIVGVMDQYQLSLVPVLSDEKIVGVVTRADIIRALCRAS